MKAPKIEFIPLREAVSSDSPITLDVLVKIIPPEPELKTERPQLNIGLVIDRSGSMRGEKIEYARQAACYAVEQLLPSDRVSVTIYDDRVDTLVPSTLATDKAYITRQIKNIEPRNITNLHGGWEEGGVQVTQHLNSEQLNRVILLSDGLANEGKTEPDEIASDVLGLAKRGVSTTTMGLGSDYNEDLLALMAKTGDGNYYYIDAPDQLPEIFQIEMQGIMATLGRNVRLSIEPQGNVELLDVFNDLDVTGKGEFKLPNLILGNPFVVGVKLQVPPTKETKNLCYFRLSWNDRQQQEQQVRFALELPVVTDAQLNDFPPFEEVQQQVALMMSARAKQEAIAKVDRGEYAAASALLMKIREEVLAVPSSPLMEQEAQALMDLDEDLKARRVQQFRKTSHYQSHYISRGHSQRTYYNYQLQRSQRYRGETAIDPVEDRVKVIQGDITEQQVEAIVNTTDPNFSGIAGLDAKVHRAGGRELFEACRGLEACEIGKSRITKGYNLPAQWIIHTVAPMWHDGRHGEVEELVQCYRTCLALAVQNSIKTIAFPAIGTGMGGFPSDRAAKIALHEVVNFLVGDLSIEKVIFVCFEPKHYNCYLDAIG